MGSLFNRDSDSKMQPQPEQRGSIREVYGIPLEVPAGVVEADTTETKTPRRRRWVRRTLGALGIAGGAVALVYGTGLMTKGDNMDDFGDLQRFTSADHQGARCDIQEAFDAQVKMNEHFDARGGVTQAEADLMGPVVGLEPAEVKSLIETDLYKMNYDCEVSVASSQEVTTGLVINVGAGGLLVGGAVGAALAYRRRA